MIVIDNCIVFGGDEQLGDRSWSFAEQLASKGFMVMKTFDESRNHHIVGGLQNLEAHIREVLDVVTQWFVFVIMNPFVVVLVAPLFIGSYEVVDEGLAEFSLGVELVLG